MTELQHPPLPRVHIIKKAIAIYLPLAYGEGKIPDVVEARVAPILASAVSVFRNLWQGHVQFVSCLDLRYSFCLKRKTFTGRPALLILT